MHWVLLGLIRSALKRLSAVPRDNADRHILVRVVEVVPLRGVMNLCVSDVGGTPVSAFEQKVGDLEFPPFTCLGGVSSQALVCKPSHHVP
jgi:hypothetical protein